MNAETVRQELQAQASVERALFVSKYFKTGPGEYGAGDKFIGVTVPAQRAIAKKNKNLHLPDIQSLLQSKIHEERATALMVLCFQSERGAEHVKKRLADFYLKNLKHINNWDLIDGSAPTMLGPTYAHEPGFLENLANSENMWIRRIAILTTLYSLGQKDAEPLFRVLPIVQDDKRDLIQKATGWMLREMGKRCGKDILVNWLKEGNRYKKLPRTALRYSIEHFSAEERKLILQSQY